MTSFRPSTRVKVFRSMNAEAKRTRRSRRPILELMEARTLLSSGQLDPTFGYLGTVPTQYAPSDLTTYPDGRFVVSGGSEDSLSVSRYTADGQLDPTFGSLGTVVYNSGVPNGGGDVALEPDGKIVIVDVGLPIALVRFNADGTLDTTFGTNGKTSGVSIDVGGGQSENLDEGGPGTLAVLPDGRILLGGRVSVSGNLDTCMAMFRTDGTLDPSFNGNGTLLISPANGYPTATGWDYPTGLEVVNNKILVSSTGGYLRQFNLDGSPDTTFGTGGIVDIEGETFRMDYAVGGESVAVQNDGKVLSNFTYGNEEGGNYDVVSRFNADGSPDLAFGTDGQATFGSTAISNENFVAGSNTALQPDGKILIGVSFNATSGLQPELLRLNSDGSLDTSFGNDGLAAPQVNGGGYPSLITVQPSGRVLLEIGSELAGVVGDPVVSFGGATSVSSSSGTSTAVYDVPETAGSATITLRRGGDLSQALSVPFSTDDSGGRAGVNYTSVHIAATFAVGSETATVTIPILDDPNASAPIDVPLVLGTPSDGAILGDVAAGDLHIVPVEGIVISPAQVSSVMQGGAGSTFTIALKSVPTGNVTVPLSISTTNPGATLSTSTLAFTPANALTPQTVTVTAAGGSGASPANAVVTVGPAVSTDPKYNGLAGGAATVAVYPSASGPGSIEFAASNFTANENAGTVQITLVRLGGSSGSVSVHFATSDGTYAAAGKYTPLSGSISFGAGVTSKTIKITLIDPGHDLQGDQTVDLTLSNPTGGAQLGVFPTASLTLHDTSQPEAGDLDSSFGTDGESILPDSLATVSAMASQPDGKLVMAGTGGTAADGSPLVRVWRTDAAGQPDPAFGQQGLALIPFPNFGQVKGIAIGADGKIVVVGNATKPAGGTEFALLRLNADGSLDTGFGNNGLVTSSFSPGDDMPSGLFVESDDSIYVAGTLDTANDAATPFAFAHYGPDGSLDIGFGNGGAQVIPAVGGPAGAVLQQPDGKWLVIAGGGYDANSDSYLPGSAVRLDSDFTPDSTFGTAGVAPLNWSEFYFSAAVQPDGKILIGGGEARNGVATLGRLNPDGSLDTTFGSGGSASTVFSVTSGGDFGITSAFTSLLVQPDGQIVAIGEADDVGVGGHYFTAEARYQSNGSPDTTFGDGGSRWFTLGDGNDSVAGAVILPDGNIAIAVTSANLPLLASIQTAGSQQTPTITWTNPASIVYGTALGAAQLDATANVPGTFIYSPAAGTVLHAGTNQTLSATFIPTDATEYTAGATTSTITVTEATPTINWANPSSMVYGTAIGAAQLDGTASWVVGGQTVSVPGTFAYAPPAGTVLQAGSHPLSVLFMPTDMTDYGTATTRVTLNVSQATPTITWANPADISPGTPLGAAQLDAAASVAGTFTYTPPAETMLSAGAHQTLAVRFTPTDTTDDTSVTSTVYINVEGVGQTIPTITWPAPADIFTGTPLGAAQLDATASVAGAFTYSPSAGTILPIGDGQTLEVTFMPTDPTHYVTTMANVSINVKSVARQTPTITWPGPAAIAYGTALEATALDATASVPGTFTYSPPAGTFLHAGDYQPLTVTFTPTNTTDYTTATDTVMINVARATPAVAWANPGDLTAGTPLSAVQLDATASIPGTFTYTPAAGTVLGAGAGQQLMVNFAPTDATDYTTATGTVQVNVNVNPPSPTPPQVTDVVRSSRTRNGLTGITVVFNEALDSRVVNDQASFKVFGAVKTRHKTVYTKAVRIKRISFDGATRVTINFAIPYKGAVKLTILGSILALDGASSDINFSAVVD
jgi:uncharacterized delta-60 repeat protein